MDPVQHAVMTALRAVVDPEVGLDIVTMGLVYGLSVGPEEVGVRLTLTTPGCPLGEMILRGAREAAERAAGGRKVTVDLVWDPPWSPAMLSREGRQALGG